MRDHGGNIDAARARFGGADWIDLSTGINRVAYPVPPITQEAWTALPTHEALDALMRAARACYRTSAAVLPVAGAQAAIQMIPRLCAPGHARVLGPTYNEHAATLRAAGWRVTEVPTLRDLAGAELAVLVNPNNPDGRAHRPADILALAAQVGRLVVDESFADARSDLSVAQFAGRERLLVLRSFGKFYGLAGVRLGFVLGAHADIAALSAMAGPWPVSGPAIQIGTAALGDIAWHAATTARLRADATRMDAIVAAAGWAPAGGCELFRLYDTPDATAAQAALARRAIWSRVFPYSHQWLRLGLPGTGAEWNRLERALAAAP